MAEFKILGAPGEQLSEEEAPSPLPRSQVGEWAYLLRKQFSGGNGIVNIEYIQISFKQRNQNSLSEHILFLFSIVF